MKVGERVRLITHQPSHPWTEQLVGEEGQVVEVKEKAIAVSGLMDGDPLWFSPKRLELIERKAA
jgi:hypothetical protein